QTGAVGGDVVTAADGLRAPSWVSFHDGQMSIGGQFFDGTTTRSGVMRFDPSGTPRLRLVIEATGTIPSNAFVFPRPVTYSAISADPRVSAQVVGEKLVIDAQAGFGGTVPVTITATDLTTPPQAGGRTAARTFDVLVTAQSTPVAQLNT